MKRYSDVSMAVLAAAVLALGAFVEGAAAMPQGTPTQPAQKAPASSEKATVVFLGNASCPVDEKAVDRDKFVEVDGQRVYVCSDACQAKLKKDPAAASAALTKAYPTATPITAKQCVCGQEIAKGSATDVTFQGRKVSLCSAGCATEFKKAPVTAIALLLHPTAKDAKNTSDPIDGKSIDAGVVAIYKSHLIHFSSYANATTFEKDPDPWMTKLKLSS